MSVTLTNERMPNGELILARGEDARGDRWVISIARMIFNYRVYVSAEELFGETYESGYCYFGTDPATYALAVGSATAWALSEDPLNTDPPQFDKKAF